MPVCEADEVLLDFLKHGIATAQVMTALRTIMSELADCRRFAQSAKATKEREVGAARGEADRLRKKLEAVKYCIDQLVKALDAS